MDPESDPESIVCGTPPAIPATHKVRYHRDPVPAPVTVRAEGALDGNGAGADRA
jgi:hypothetical protein